MTALLASVTSVEEALIALEGGADIIDLKDPVSGALGALPLTTIREIVSACASQRPTSATVGDLPPDPVLLCKAVNNTTLTGVDYVKVGFFGDPAGHPHCIAALGEQVRNTRLVAVLFADRKIHAGSIDALAKAGFAGVMLDTADKNQGRLCSHRSIEELDRFIACARQAGLLNGLAGSLCADDIDVLLKVKPDYLGFRSALCSGARTSSIDRDAVEQIRARIPRAPQSDHELRASG